MSILKSSVDAQTCWSRHKVEAQLSADFQKSGASHSTELFSPVNRVRQSGFRANSNGVDKELKGGRIQLRRHSYCPENYQLPQWIQNNNASMSCLRPSKKTPQ